MHQIAPVAFDMRLSSIFRTLLLLFSSGGLRVVDVLMFCSTIVKQVPRVTATFPHLYFINGAMLNADLSC